MKKEIPLLIKNLISKKKAGAFRPRFFLFFFAADYP